MNNIIRLSCGIGKTIAESTIALQKSKQKKHREINIELYKGEKLEDKLNYQNNKTKAFEYLLDKYPEEKEKFMELLYDEKTAMLNRLGYSYYGKKWNSGYRLFFDCDDMHYWNSKIGYSEVDKRLEIIGQTIVKEVGLGYAHRVNENAGDEFLAYTEKEPSKIAERIIKKCYTQQTKLN